MTPPNDMPADTELRAKVHAIILKTDDYTKFCAIQDMPWNRSGNLLDELMQLIKSRDEAREREIRIDEWKTLGDFLTEADKVTISHTFLDLYRIHGEGLTHPPKSTKEGE